MNSHNHIDWPEVHGAVSYERCVVCGAVRRADILEDMDECDNPNCVFHGQGVTR